MSFKDCIQSAVDAGRLGAKKAEEAFAAYDEAFASGKADGLSDDAAGDLAAGRSLDAITELKSARRWQRVNELRKAHTLYQEFHMSKDPAKALIKLPERMEYAYNRIRGQAMASLDAFILKYMPKLGGLHIPLDNLDNVVRAAFGDVRNPEAGAIAKTVEEVRKFLARVLIWRGLA